MSGPLEADDLTLLRDGFAAAFDGARSADEVDAAVVDLGWIDLLTTLGRAGLAPMFAAAGASGRLAGVLDDVVALELGVALDPRPCIVHPAAHTAEPPGQREGDTVVVDGLVSSRLDSSGIVHVPVAGGGAVEVVAVDAAPLVVSDTGLDPGASIRHVRGRADAGPTVTAATTWTRAIGSARVALAHHLVAEARWMLDAARTHAVDRQQFGRPIASFQAVRHKLAETLVVIEGAAAVVDGAADTEDELATALAKSLAGQAALTAARHAQQVLAGMGFTADHPFPARMKLAVTVDALYGSARTLPNEIGRELTRRGGAPRLVDL